MPLQVTRYTMPIYLLARVALEKLTGRILAKSMNCQAGISPKACGECPSCIGISEGNSVDVIEIDAASRTKVEDTRELLEQTQFHPVNGRFKIFIIDEVHMLSGHSFNALLKTLEEPLGMSNFY